MLESLLRMCPGSENLQYPVPQAGTVQTVIISQLATQKGQELVWVTRLAGRWKGSF